MGEDSSRARARARDETSVHARMRDLLREGGKANEGAARGIIFVYSRFDVWACVGIGLEERSSGKYEAEE